MLELNLGPPQIIMLILYLLGLCVGVREHGRLKTGKHSAWTTVLALAINMVLLSWGGFFDAR